MIPALCTVLAWSISAMCASQAAAAFGATRANRLRLLIATTLLALVAVCTARSVLEGTGLAAPWFLASGLLGLALGDQALLMAYERLGARLPTLITHCGAAPCALVVEWWWLGQAPRARTAPLLVLILAGVLLAMLPRRGELRTLPWPVMRQGILLSLASAAALAAAAVVARRGFAAGMPAGAAGAVTAGTLRGLGACALVWAPVALPWGRRTPRPSPDARAWWWLGATAVFGPGLGVVCYQAALARLPSAEVQAVVALVPVLVLPLAGWSEGRPPSLTTLLGALLAVAGTAGLALVR